VLRLWDVEAGKELRPRQGHAASLACVAVSPDGEWIGSSGSDRLSRLWTVPGGEPATTIPSPGGGFIRELAFTLDSRRLALRPEGGPLLVLQVPPQGAPLVLPAPGQIPTALAWAPDGQTLALATRTEACVWLLDPVSGQQKRMLPGLKEVSSMTYSPDGQCLAVVCETGEAWLWDLAERQPRPLKEQSRQSLRRVAFSPDGQSLAAGSDDGTVKLWRLSDGEPSQPPLARHRTAVSALVCAADSTRLVTADGSGMVLVWEARAGRFSDEPRLLQLPGPVASILALASDGRHLITGNANGTVYVLRLHSLPFR
jgi:WD40 repeat protein